VNCGGGVFKVALEIEGPSHYTINTLQPTGPTRMRDHVIQGEGWVVVNIPFFEYKRSMPRSEKYVYIRSKLAAVGYLINHEVFGAAMADARKTEQHAGGGRKIGGTALEVNPDLKPRPAWRSTRRTNLTR